MDAALDFLAPYLEEYAYLGLFLILSVGGFGLPIPEELVLVAAGLLVAWGSTELLPTLAVCAAGMVIGDALFFAVGRRFGLGHVHGFIRRLAPPDRVDRVIEKVHRYGLWVVFFGRYLTGVRPVVFLGAGASGIPFGRFALVDGLSAAVALGVWVTVGNYWSGWLELVLRAVGSAEEVIITVAVSMLVVFLIQQALLRFGKLGSNSWEARAVRTARIPILVLSAIFALVLARHHDRNERASLIERHAFGVPTKVTDLGLAVSILSELTRAEEPVEMVFVAPRESMLASLQTVGFGIVEAPTEILFGRPPDVAVGGPGDTRIALWRSWFLYRSQPLWLGRVLGPPQDQAKNLGKEMVKAGVARRTSFGPHVRGSNRRIITVLLRHAPS